MCTFFRKQDTSLVLPVIWCLIAALLFGASTPASKLVLGQIGPRTLAGLLYLGAAVAVFPVIFRGASFRLIRARVQLIRLGGAVLFGGILGPMFLLLGLNSAPASSVSLWLNLESVATAVIAWAFFKEHIGPRTGAAVVLIVMAGAVMALPEGLGAVRAVVLVALACVCWGLDNNFTSLIDGLTPAQVTFVKGIIGGAFNLTLGLAIETNVSAASPVLWAMLIGAAGYGLSILLYISASQQLGASRSQMLFAVSPFLGTCLSWVVLGEPVQPIQIGAGAIMALGLGLMLSESHGHSHSHVAATHLHYHSHDDGHHDHHHDRIEPGSGHAHEHDHPPAEHSHPHMPDLHHRHKHKTAR